MRTTRSREMVSIAMAAHFVDGSWTQAQMRAWLSSTDQSKTRLLIDLIEASGRDEKDALQGRAYSVFLIVSIAMGKAAEREKIIENHRE